MSWYSRLCDRFLGNCVHHIESSAEPTLYLTFDDGPTSYCTPSVLDLLKKHDAHATFFLIGQRAEREPDLVKRIVSEGHAIGNHSYDHDQRNFFSSDTERMKAWISKGERALQQLGATSVGFRSPNGVRTRALHRALRDLSIPLVHWDVRFYDTICSWTEARAERGLSEVRSGSIILLHDSHQGEKQKNFLKTLEFFLTRAKSRGFSFRRIELIP